MLIVIQVEFLLVFLLCFDILGRIPLLTKMMKKKKIHVQWEQVKMAENLFLRRVSHLLAWSSRNWNEGLVADIFVRATYERGKKNRCSQVSLQQKLLLLVYGTNHCNQWFIGKKNFFCFHYNKGRSKMLSPSYKKIKSVTEHLLNKF